MTTRDAGSVDALADFIQLLEGLGADFGTEDETTADRILRLSQEIEGGRAIEDVFRGLLLESFQDIGLTSPVAGADAPIVTTDPDLIKSNEDALRIAQQIASGERTAEDVTRSLQGVIDRRIAAGDVRIIDPDTGLPIGGGENVTIPTGATLVKITDPTGTDRSVRYAVTYDAFGVTFSFNIGDVGDFADLFPGGEALFDNVQTVSQQQFDESDFVQSGSLDQAGLIGRRESFQSLIELQIEQAGLGDLPDWLRNSPEAMALVATGAAQGWDAGRTWVELSQTDAFKTRFTAFDEFRVEGETIQTTLERLLSEEESLASALTRFRPSGFQITTDYLQEVLARGFTSQQAAGLLAAEKVLLNNPGALANLNAIRIASGAEALDEAGLINAMAGEAPEDLIEQINTAAAGQALEEAGFEGVDVETLVEVIDDITAIRTPEDFTALAQNLALVASQNRAELERGAFDITREELFATIFNEDPTEVGGRSRGEVLTLLAKFERERRAAAGFSGGFQGFSREGGGLQLQGLGGL